MGNKLKKIFLDLISFNNPASILIVLSLVLIFLFIFPTNSLQDLPIKSVYSSVFIPIFNDSCEIKNCGFYSIGQTRGVSSILHGEFEKAWEYNPLSYILLVTIIILIILNIFKLFKKK